MTKRSDGLWPLTEMVLREIELTGFVIPKIEAHDPDDIEGSDFIWGELTPHLELSEGEYMTVSHEFGKFCSDFGMRGCCGGDPTLMEGIRFAEPTNENARLIAKEFVEYFTRKQ
jgi:hypothetical protein